MIGVRVGVEPDEVRFDARHVLFVEGAGDDAIDPTVLRVLLGSQIRIEPLGASFSVRSVAEALHASHPNYYFLIDRDHYDDRFVEESWHTFPDPGKRNLLVWRRREIENYFLDADYLALSRYFIGDVENLRGLILALAQRRLYLDVCNSVIVQLREKLKQNRFRTFTDLRGFTTREVALRALLNRPEFDGYRKLVDEAVSSDRVEQTFRDTLRRMTGAGDTIPAEDRLGFGRGRWIEMMRGKKLLTETLNSRFFRVEDRYGNRLSGKQERNEVVRDLLRREDAIRPPDFIELKRIIERRIRGSSVGNQ